MVLDYSADGKPILKFEKDGVTVVIAFADETKQEKLKETVMELLTAAYEKRIQTT
ncbi:MAG: hypothetical protein IJW55_06790 [Clostridia bacterium]|nr:hypothetical protein [Clostridia bacterium]